MIEALRNGELSAARELTEMLLGATGSEQIVDDVLTIILGLLPEEARRKMLGDHTADPRGN
jgi:hypothetical protein